MKQKINNWYTNYVTFRSKGLERAPGGRPGSWTFRSVVSQYHKERIAAMCQKLKKEAKLKLKEAEKAAAGDEPRRENAEEEDIEVEIDEKTKDIPFYQPALSAVEAEVKSNEEEEDQIHQLVALWNNGPPVEVQRK